MSNNKTFLITIGLLSLTLFGLTYLWQSQETLSAEIELANVPLTLGAWKGKDIPISAREFAILGTKDVLLREYTNAQGEKVVLAVVYSGMNRGSFHPPELCYLGGGRQLLNKGSASIEIADSTLPVNKLLLEDKKSKEIIWYWFTGGKRITSSYYLQQCYFIWDELRRRGSGGSLIRVSTRMTGNDLKGAETTGKDFIREFTPILLDYLN